MHTKLLSFKEQLSKHFSEKKSTKTQKPTPPVKLTEQALTQHQKNLQITSTPPSSPRPPSPPGTIESGDIVLENSA